MVERVAGDRETPPLDRVGEHDARAVGDLVALPIRVEQAAEVVAGEVGHERSQLLIADPVDECPQLVGAVVDEARPQPRAVEPEERLVPLVLHRVDVGAERIAARAGERVLEQRAVLRLDDVPPGAAEELDDLLDLLVGDHAVEALPVDVDDPRHVAEPLQGRIGDRLPDVALVELGVADECDEPGRPLGHRPEVGVDVPASHRREERGDGPEPDRAGREVGDVGVLRAARVGLQAADRPQPRQVRPVEFAGQVLDRVVHRAGVRLDGDLVVARQVPEPQRGHDRHHRRRRGLVATDLDRHPGRGRGPLPVGVVDHPGRQPQDPLLHPTEHVEIDRFGHRSHHATTRS